MITTGALHTNIHECIFELFDFWHLGALVSADDFLWGKT
jgi:hypothetical protein